MRIGFDINRDAWEFFVRTCKEKKVDPIEAIPNLIKESISTYLTCVSAEQDPQIKRMADAIADYVGPDAKRTEPYDRWPWSERNKPVSFEAAVRNAKRRGARFAAKLAATA